ncbi:MAG: hypothetical protein ACI4O9_01935 [Akkermansia sp.]
MLFESASLSPQGRLEAIERLFEELARRKGGVPPEPGHVPVAVLEAYGAWETPLRHRLEAAFTSATDRRLRCRLRALERSLNALPSELMAALAAEPADNWPAFYRALMRLHAQVSNTLPDIDPEEYAAELRRTVELAAAVSEHSLVCINAAGLFTLLLMQVELERQHPSRPPKRRRRRRRR